MLIAEVYDTTAKAWDMISLDETKKEAVQAIWRHAFANKGINKYRVISNKKPIVYKTIANLK